MKKKILIAASLLSILAISSCSMFISNSKSSVGEDVSGNNSTVEIVEDNITSDFSLVDSLGNSITSSDGIYNINVAGTYYASGKIDGQIYVDAANETVEIDLKGVSISNDSVSPIYVNDCEDIIIKAVKNYNNYIYDNRDTDYSNTSTTDATSAIYVSNGDLKINGKGSLEITSIANSGIHSKDNVKVKNVTMLIKAQNNGIKGNDKVEIDEDITLGIVCGNNGIVTSNSDMGTNIQHGNIYISGGDITINSYGDAIDAAYSVYIDSKTDDEGVTYTPSIDIYTNIYSSYELNTNSVSKSNALGPGGGFDGGGMSGGSSAEKADDSAKGIKANELIEINDGNLFIYAYDDCIHTNKDVLLDTGTYGSANININGATINLKASDDAIHADGTLSVTDGVIYVQTSHEGIEAKKIDISGGDITVYGDDDGINASSSIVISGGRVDVFVSSSGDVDGIDSNGTISITGGIVITRGPNSEMACALDADSSITITGGVVIIIGYSTRLTTNLNKTQSQNGLSSGQHSVIVSNQTINYENQMSYSGVVTVYSSSSATIN